MYPDDRGTTALYAGKLDVELGCNVTHHLLCLEQKTAPTLVSHGLTKRVFATPKTTPGGLVKTGSTTTPHEAADSLNWSSFSVNESGIAGYANPQPGSDASWTGGPTDLASESGRCSDAAALYRFEQ